VSSGGVLARIGTSCVAVAIVVLVVGVASDSGHASVTVYNGLGRPVHVTMGTQTVDVGAFGHRSLQVGDTERLHVRASTADGRTIDEFDAALSGRGAHDVYNIASAGVLVSWTAAYGNASKTPPRVLGAPHWINVRADVEFQEPPRSISTKAGGGTRSVLTGLSGEDPEEVLGPLGENRKEIFRIIRAHARWDDARTPHASDWSDLARRVESGEFGTS
jgi:hypothetical protein